MPLNINESLRSNGVAGTDGTAGRNGSDIDPNGGAGGSGQSGADVLLGRDGLVLLGDAGGDRIVFELQAVGGRGGSGSLGGAGKNPSATVAYTNSPGSSLTEAVYGAAGTGGAGGWAGDAGVAEVAYTHLDIDLAGGATQNSVRLWGTAWGGNGGNGGASGAGGSSGYSGLTSSTTLGPPAFTTTYSQLGSAGGAAPDGADGAAGAAAAVRFDDIQVVGENNLVTLYGIVIGGSGGSGGSGSRGGSGSTGAAGGHGGHGGDGALGLAEATRLDVQAALGLNLTIYLDARGGQGNQGGGGGGAGSGRRIDGSYVNGVGSTLDTTVYAGHGRGGDGGNGGDGVARLADSTIRGSSITDNVLLYLRAAGSLAGSGGLAPAAVASSSSSGSSSVTVVQGTAAGTLGNAGTVGNALVAIENITLSLGDGNDRVELDLLASGPGVNQVVVSGNTFNGGLGTDRLVLGTGKLGEPGAVVNVAQGFFRLGSSPVDNALSGFELFDATLADDLFIGGAGGQAYALRGGNDTFVGGDGNESVDGGDGADSLDGGRGNDTLLGAAGADTLIGGRGADSLVGGTGDDLYIVDGIDTVVEFAGGGIDTVRSAGSHSLAAEVEVLELTGALNVNGTGNALANVITGTAGNNRLSGGDGNDTLWGGNGDDTLNGGLGADSLAGGAGDDTLIGGRGADSLVGGAGDDVYTVDAIDTIVELAGGGIDTVRSAGSHVLAAEVEVLQLTGALNASGTGNALDNTLIGNSGNNRLAGGDGNDTLSGGTGADTFVFDAPSTFDTVSDFTSGTDMIHIAATALAIGNGDNAVDGAAILSGPGGFGTDAELVIFTSHITGPITSAAAAETIGDANASYAVGSGRVFVVDNGSSAGVFLFTALDANASVSAAELNLLGSLTTAGGTTALGDYLFG